MSVACETRMCKHIAGPMGRRSSECRSLPVGGRSLVKRSTDPWLSVHAGSGLTPPAAVYNAEIHEQ